MSLPRRDFVKAALGATALAAAPRPLLARFGTRWEPVPPIEDPRVKALALRGVEAARAAGAAYADVRLTHTRVRHFLNSTVRGIRDTEQMAVGVRALFNGAWGFAASAQWDRDEVARLGAEAVAQARAQTLPAAQADPTLTLVPTPLVRDEHWTMPIERDPFEVSPFEIVDFLQSLSNVVAYTPEFRVSRNGARFQVQELAFASSEGSYGTQWLYRSQGEFVVQLYERGRVVLQGALEGLTPAGLGWELYTGQSLHEAVARLLESLQADWRLPAQPIEVGRYDTVCDAATVAHLLDATLGTATQLDRALGDEANAGGTSYLSDPLALVGHHVAAAPAITVTANRREPGGAATVAWDDEGVRPDEFVLVKDGVLVDFQTTRESARWLAEAYAKTGQVMRSHGCAAAPGALEAPLTHTPNLVLRAGRDALDWEDALAAVGDGLAVRELQLDMDYQGLHGFATGSVYAVKRGKRVARVVGAGLLFRAPELWKGLLALGDARSARRVGFASRKGEPAQTTYHSVTAPLAAFKQLTVIDPRRKA